MDNLRGITLMVAAMVGFAIEDMFLKLSAAEMPTGQVIFATGLFGALVFAVIALVKGASLVRREMWLGMAGWRNFGEVIGTCGYVTSLALIPLSMASAILQAQPLTITCCAALFLGEQVGWRRWTAVCVGFIGVLIVIRPGTDGFQPEALWGVMGVIGLTLRDIATRQVPRSISSIQLGFTALLAMTVLGAVMLVIQGGPVMLDMQKTLVLSGALVSGTAAYVAVVAAARVGEMSVVTPFRYIRLLFALIIGAIVFSESPDRWVLIGAAMIIGSGLYTLARERKRKIASANKAPLPFT